MPLTTEQIENARPGTTPDGRTTHRPYKMGDSRGLFLEVPPTGSKRWRLKYRFAGREKQLSLGLYPDVSLYMARGKRDAMRALLASGQDPSEVVRQERAEHQKTADRLAASTRFMLDNHGSLTISLGTRRVSLNASETADLRVFLAATSAVAPLEDIDAAD